MTNYEERLEKFRVVLLQEFSREVIEHTIDITSLAHFAYDAATVRIKYVIWGQRIADRVEVKYPANWKEAIKERFAPAWFLNRWPVVYNKTVLDLAVLFPNFRNTPKILGDPVYVNMPEKIDLERVEGIEYVNPT